MTKDKDKSCWSCGSCVNYFEYVLVGSPVPKGGAAHALWCPHPCIQHPL